MIWNFERAVPAGSLATKNLWYAQRMELITNMFVLVAPDCPVTAAVVPIARGTSPTVPVLQYELLTARPYSLTLEDLIFEVHVRQAGLSRPKASARSAEIRAELFAKPHPCMRASALPKRYGGGGPLRQ